MNKYKLLKTYRLIINRYYHSEMRAWQITKYSNNISSSLTLNKCHRPVIRNPNDVLIKVNASSINPIDLLISTGYGHNVLSLWKSFSDIGINKMTHDRLPLTLGRDLSGLVVQVGQSVNKFKIGDLVWGCQPPHQPGTHADYVVTHQTNINHKPNNLNDTEAASLPYVFLTAWSAITNFGQLNQNNTFGKKVLVLGGSGGVGLVAIQLLKYWGANVITTCSSNAIEFVNENAKPNQCIDYNTNDLLGHIGTFDFVLDCTPKLGSHRDQDLDFTVKYLKQWSNSKLVTLSSPLLDNIQQYGFIGGTFVSLMHASRDTINGLSNGTTIRWGFFASDPNGLSTLTRLCEEKQIIPVIENVYNFNELINAYTKASLGHSRGKTVIDHTKSENNHSINQETHKI